MADELEGRGFERLYANHLEVGHNAFEFFLDFGTRSPEGREAKFHTGIVTSPGCAEAFFETVRKALQDYTEAHGRIPTAGRRAEEGP
jgi:Protein of unknown function (DUF3467)